MIRSSDHGYYLIRPVGNGGTAEVWKALRLPDLQICAVKIRQKTVWEKAESPKRRIKAANHSVSLLLPLEAEAKLMKTLTKPSKKYINARQFPEFPQFLEYIQDKNNEYLAMEYLPGITLGESLRKGNACSEEQIQNLMVSLITFLAKLHSQDPPILFLDLTPDNILLAPDGALRLIDLGAAAVWYYRDQMAESIVFGTPGYVCMEQCLGHPGPAADLYSLNILLRLLTSAAIS